jgi:hypothetical protein
VKLKDRHAHRRRSGYRQINTFAAGVRAACQRRQVTSRRFIPNQQ